MSEELKQKVIDAAKQLQEVTGSVITDLNDYEDDAIYGKLFNDQMAIRKQCNDTINKIDLYLNSVWSKEENNSLEEK